MKGLAMIIAHASESITTFEPAFVHAVGLAVHSGATVRGLHVARELAAEPSPPSTRGLLERWGRVGQEIDHAWRLATTTEDVSETLLEMITAIGPGLLVVSHRSRSGLERLSSGSISENVARNFTEPVLLLPNEGPFLVSAQTGAFTLDRALVLSGPSDDARRAVSALVMLIELAGASPCTVELLHVDDGTPPAHPAFPPGFDVIHHRSRGPIERAVSERALRLDPQLIVMASRGHDQLSDILFASHTERVLHTQRRPLLWVPV
jgi:nucleotide-binding universal stress UspA family protein